MAASKASLAGEDFGNPGPLSEQAHLGDFMIDLTRLLVRKGRDRALHGH